jgi:hypothetical protein
VLAKSIWDSNECSALSGRVCRRFTRNSFIGYLKTGNAISWSSPYH